ncbi:unnamed protein product [Spirodela intermedia]|uniref:Uncharacterized protein n=1 Tax=Spirodela intermedia TaxID=51605 RepID=A0ABN7E880_SPIIN|nr:unnamed protein product [Spirodela intermedia]
MGHRIVFGSCHLTEWKIATLRLSDGCHPTERSWIEVATHLSADRPLSNDVPFSRVCDHSLLHNRLATGDMQGE